MAKKNTKKNNEFHWNVWVWGFNRDTLETYDVVPTFLREYKSLKKDEKPKTKEEFEKFLKSNATYFFWSKCEWEMIVHGHPVGKKDEKVDVYQQLMLNWDVFVDAFWDSLQEKKSLVNADHRKQRGRTAPNRALKR